MTRRRCAALIARSGAGFLMINNMLDQKYSTSGIMAVNVLTGGGALERIVVPAPGIAFYGGLSYRFEAL